jgi:G3E family GTPase
MRAEYAPLVETLVPVTIVGGDSRSGKSSLLGHLLAHHQGPPLAVMVSEASASFIEANHVVQRDGEFLTLGNGSLVRAADDEYSSALSLLQHRQPPASRVFLEAAGAARLRGMAGYGYMPGYRSDGIVVVVDAETIRERAASPEDSTRLMGQLACADIVVVNKVDLLAASARSAVTQWLTSIYPGVRVIETSFGRVPSELLVGVGPEDAMRDMRVLNSSWETTFRPNSRKARASAAGDHAPQPRLWLHTTPDPITAQGFRAWADRLPGTIVRARGSVYVREDVFHRYEFELVGRRYHFQRAGRWDETAPETRLALVGL